MNRYLDILNLIIKNYNVYVDGDVQELIDFLTAQGKNAKPAFTASGLAILEYLQGCDKSSLKAKDIAEGMCESPKKISGAIRKLCTDGYVDKFGQTPVTYSLTDKGRSFDIQAYKNKIEN